MDIRTTITIAFILLIIWYILFVAGTIQYRILKKKTIELVMKYGKKALEGNLEKSNEAVYEALYPEWREMIKKTALFIPDKTELRPILANEKNVIARFIFSPRWVKDCLKDHQIDFDAN
jgi:hypothetical protein